MRKPAWLRTTLPKGEGFAAVNEQLRQHRLNTVCSSARCPNLADCWGRGTATFMLLGDTCTRSCRFCSVATGNPGGRVDETEPARVAAAAAELGLEYVVLTSVDRDDLDDFGAGAFAATIKACRTRRTSQTDSTAERPLVEALVPDFGGREDLVRAVVDAGPDVFGHNVETVERTSPLVRDRRASYRRSFEVLETVKRVAPGMTTKSGLMVGLGETDEEVVETLRDLRRAGCDIVTIGQYLQPSRRCVPVQRYVEPSRFREWEAYARQTGFRQASCGPMVRSSYRAQEAFPAGGGFR